MRRGGVEQVGGWEGAKGEFEGVGVAGGMCAWGRVVVEEQRAVAGERAPLRCV